MELAPLTVGKTNITHLSFSTARDNHLILIENIESLLYMGKKQQKKRCDNEALIKNINEIKAAAAAVAIAVA